MANLWIYSEDSLRHLLRYPDGHTLSGTDCLLFCSIIGIPVAIVMAKSLGTLLQPVGKVCVDHSVAQALLVEQGRSQLANMNKIEQQ